MSATRLTMSAHQVKAAQVGAVAGIGGGLVFGAMMAMGGMLPMVGMLVKQENAVVGFMVHLIISAFIGAVYGSVATRLPATWLAAIGGGAVNGVVWWILGALILMPLLLGMTQMIFVIGEMQWMSLMGHLVYGVITGALFNLISRRV
ncbi:MAG: hypothetical protein HZC40_04910 [Chloroflexi bacterium]|nr:hypothetical protein [Chloroflexota bacterium]